MASGSIASVSLEIETIADLKRKKAKARVLSAGPNTRKQAVLAATRVGAGLCGLVRISQNKKIQVPRGRIVDGEEVVRSRQA